MPTLFEDDFETGDLSKFDSPTIASGCTLEVSAAAKYRGSYGLYIKTTGDTSAQLCFAPKNVGVQNPIHGRAYLCVKTKNLVDADDRIGFLLHRKSPTTQRHSAVVIRHEGIDVFGIRYTESVGVTKTVYSDIEVQLDTVYCVEFIHIKGDKVQLFVDGELACEATPVVDEELDTIAAAISTTGVDGISEIYIDDFVIANEYIGEVPPPPVPPTMAETMSEMINSMMSVMMLVMVMQMMTGMMKGLRKK